MRGIRVWGLCGLAAAVSFSLLFAVPAFAKNNPEFFYCVKEAAGKYEDAACSVEGAKKEFSRKAPGVGEIAYNSSGKPSIDTRNHAFECASVETTGETDGALIIQNMTMMFKTCEDKETHKLCHSFTTQALFGELYYLKKGHTPPAIFVLGPKVGNLWAKFKCEAVPPGAEPEYELLGRVIGEVGTTEKAVATNQITFKHNLLPEQEIIHIEEEPALGTFELEVQIVGGAKEKAALENVETQKWPCPNMGIATK
jgi:hypothetical protein